MIEQFKLTETSDVHPPKKDDAYNIITWANVGGGIQKQIDHFLISDNVETWLKYTKVKGLAGPKQGGRRRILKNGNLG